MRIEGGGGEPRTGDPFAPDHLIQQPGHVDDPVEGHLPRHLRQRNVGGDEDHPQISGGLHHHEIPSAAQLGDPFGMAGEGDSCQVDRILVHRGGDQRPRLPGEHIERRHGERVIGEFAAARRSLADRQLRKGEASGGTDLRQNAPAPPLRRLGEDRRLAVEAELHPPGEPGIGGGAHRQLRTDSGRISRRHGDDRQGGLHRHHSCPFLVK